MAHSKERGVIFVDDEMLKISVHSYQLMVHPWCGGSMNSESYCIFLYCIDVVLLLLILKMCKLIQNLVVKNYQTKLAKKAKAKLKL